jgi:hypothetical protein
MAFVCPCHRLNSFTKGAALKKLDLKRARQFAIIMALLAVALFGQSVGTGVESTGTAYASGIDWPRR